MANAKVEIAPKKMTAADSGSSVRGGGPIPRERVCPCADLGSRSWLSSTFLVSSLCSLW
ncbi:MAG: hypothetical protein ACYDHX_12240 [Methanothrix sp.]